MAYEFQVTVDCADPHTRTERSARPGCCSNWCHPSSPPTLGNAPFVVYATS